MESLDLIEDKTFMYYKNKGFTIKYSEFSLLLANMNLDDTNKVIKTYLESLKKVRIERLKREINNTDKLRHTFSNYFFNFKQLINKVLDDEYVYLGNQTLFFILSDLMDKEINNKIEEKINTINANTSSESDYAKLNKSLVDDISPKLKDLEEAAKAANRESKSMCDILEKQFISELEEEIKEGFNKITSANDSIKLHEAINRIKIKIKAINNLSDDSEKNKQIFEAIWDILLYIPVYLCDSQFQKELKMVLLRQDTLSCSYILNESISNAKVSTSKIINEDKGINTIYHFSDINSLLWVDLQKYLESDKQIKTCEQCGRLFMPTSGKNTKYCSFPNRNTELKCAEIRHRKVNDLMKEVKRARGNQQRFVSNVDPSKGYLSKKFEYDFPELKKKHDQWSHDMSDKYREFKKNADLQGLKDWIQDHKFNVKKMDAWGIRTRLTVNEKRKGN